MPSVEAIPPAAPEVVDPTNTEGWKDFLPPRDFTGYGLEPPADCWPEGKKIAVSFVLNWEEGSEHTAWNGDTRSEAFLHEHHYHRTPVTGGKRDIVVESSFEYGIRAGLPRLLKLFDKYGWRFTIWANARALEVAGDYGKEVAKRGHEIACHGNRWTYGPDMKGKDDEARHIRQSFDRLQKATGLANVPTSWFGGSGSIAHKHMRARIHKERGVPLVYCGDGYGADLPYWIPSPLTLDGEEDEGMLMVPYSLTNNDHRFMVSHGCGVAAPKDWSDLLIMDFDYLLEEAKAGSPKMQTIAMHNRILGKPARMRALKRFMDHIKDRDDVWITTRAEIASHWKEKYPYEVVGATRDLHTKD